MKDDPRSGQTIGTERGELADCRRRSVFGVVGLDPGVLEPRDVRENTMRRPSLGRREICGHELWKLPAIGDHDRRARLVGAHKRPRHRAEQIVARDPA